MKIVLAGQLDRVFANEFAIFVGLEPDDDTDLEAVESRRSADTRYFQMACTLAALSDEIIPLPYVRHDNNPVYRGRKLELLEAVTDAKAIASRVEAIAHFDQVADEALDLVKGCTLLWLMAAKSDDVLNDIGTEEAWIGNYHALRHLHGDDGIPDAYHAGLLMQALLAWETGAVLVLAECDRRILADLGATIVRQGWPRPFAIPDLRYMGPPYNDKICGPLLDLRPTDLANVEALKSDPGLCAYAETISNIVSGAEAENVGSALRRANCSSRSGIHALADDHARITLVAASVRMFGNASTVTPGVKPSRDARSRRRLPQRMLRTIVLS